MIGTVTFQRREPQSMMNCKESKAGSYGGMGIIKVNLFFYSL